MTKEQKEKIRRALNDVISAEHDKIRKTILNEGLENDWYLRKAIENAMGSYQFIEDLKLTITEIEKLEATEEKASVQ